MRLAIIPETLVDWVILRLRLVPRPIIECFPSIVLARSIMLALQLDCFEALADEAQTAAKLAERCQLEVRATEKLLDTLVGSGYLHATAGYYRLSTVARTWLLRDSPRSIRDFILFNFVQWNWLQRLDCFVRTGTSIDIHHEMDDDQWVLYQRAMRCLARLSAPEVVHTMPAFSPLRSHRAIELLDIGGANGAYASAFCRRYADLRATILDLPEAIAAAAPLLAEERLGNRLVLRRDDALTASLGQETFDVIFIANLLHHFSASANQELTKRAALALRPGGYLIIQEGLREHPARAMNQFGSLGSLFFALTSAAGVWSFTEMATWQQDAGLRPIRSARLLTAPGQGLQIARKPHKRH